MSTRTLALLATLAVVLAAAAPASAARPENLVLRLADLGPGYRIPDELCVPTRLRGDGTSRVVDQIGRLPHRGCEITFSRAWVAPGAPPGPREASSRAFVFTDAAGPQAALTRPRAVASFMFQPTRDEFEVVEPAPTIGDEAVLLHVEAQRFHGRSWWTSIVLWRAGNVLAAVEAIGTESADATAQAVLRLAAAQQARLATPTPLRAEDNDEREVGLDDPNLRLPVYWFGHELAARGRLPGLSLFRSETVDFGPVHNALVLGYGRGGTVFVELLPPRTLQQRPIRRELRRVARDACTRRERIKLPAGRATIWFRARGCDTSQADTFAIARLPGIVVVIGFGGDSDLGPATRYVTRTGMLRLLHALRERAPATG